MIDIGILLYEYCQRQPNQQNMSRMISMKSHVGELAVETRRLAQNNKVHYDEDAKSIQELAREYYREVLRIRRDLGLLRGYACSFEHRCALS